MTPAHRLRSGGRLGRATGNRLRWAYGRYANMFGHAGKRAEQQQSKKRLEIDYEHERDAHLS